MLTKGMREILSEARPEGWVMEPEAKRFLSLAGLDVPRFKWEKTPVELARGAAEIGYPVVGKVVSPRVVHKSEVKGVVVGIENEHQLREVFARFSRIEGFAGMLVEERVDGLELIIGAKVDEQFGPVVLLGLGGTGVEIYKDVSLRMAPLSPRDVDSMVNCLKARPLLEGYRGGKPISRKELERLLLTFSEVIMDLEDEVASIDLNPVICSPERCVVADARMMLRSHPGL